MWWADLACMHGCSLSTVQAGFTLRRNSSSGTKPTYVTSDPNKIASRHALYNNNATLAPRWRKPFFRLQPSPIQDETRGPLITTFFVIVIQRSLSGTGLESLLFWGRIMAPAPSTAWMSTAVAHPRVHHPIGVGSMFAM